MQTSCKCILVFVLCLMSLGAHSDEWLFGIGTGISFLKINGDTGFNAPPLGTVEFDSSMSSNEFRELTESAFGFGGFAKNGKLTILFSLSQLELEDDVNINGTTNKVTFTKGASELAGVYEFAQSGYHRFNALFGLNYTRQKYETSSITDDVDENWVDVIIGATHSHPLSKTSLWSNRLDIGSEGRIYVETSIAWLLSDSWTTKIHISANRYDYENSHKGNSDWYKYDATESAMAFSFAYLF